MPARKLFKSVTSKIKEAGSSKRQRDDDPNYEDYNPDPSDLVAASSVAEAGDDSSMEEDNGSNEDEISDVLALNFLERNWTTEAYSNARSENQFNQARDTNVLFFYTQV